jgi:hypothetical protein
MEDPEVDDFDPTHTFCKLIPFKSKRSETIALAKRGDCDFALKAINAQAAGFKALLILDNKDHTSFYRFEPFSITFFNFSRFRPLQNLAPGESPETIILTNFWGF